MIRIGVVVLVLCLGYQLSSAQRLAIIPAPQQIIHGEGAFSLAAADSFKLLLPHIPSGDLVSQNAEKLLRSTIETLGHRYTIQRGEVDTYGLSFYRTPANLAENIPSDFQLQAEGYWMKIQEDEILGKADDPAGFLYLVQSLRQLFYGVGQVYHSIPCATIIDHPSFSFRGIMDDISRGPLPTLAFMKEQVRRYATYKFNVISFYIEHVLKTDRHHTFAPPDGLTLSELQELQEYAAAFNIQVMGSFQSLGHFRNILQHQDYAHLGVGDRMLNPGDSLSLQFLRDMYDDIIPTASHPIFNINCDEAYDLARGPLRSKAEEIGEDQIFAQHIVPLLQHIEKRGKRPGMWGDMLLKHPQVIPMLPPETVIFTWNYDAESDFNSWLHPFTDQQLDVVACTGVLNSNRLWPDLSEAQLNIKRFTNAAFEAKVLGTLCAVWDDGGRHFFNTDWLGVSYAGALAWNADSFQHNSFDSDYDLIHFQDTLGAFTDMLKGFSALDQIPRLGRLNNLLLNFNFGSAGLLEEYIDTSDFYRIRQVLGPLKTSLENHQKELTSKTLIFQTSEHDIWQLKADQLLFNIETADFFLKYFSTNSTPLENPCAHLDSIKQGWHDLKNIFGRLWTLENRTHWLYEANKIYDEKIKVFDHILVHRCGHVKLGDKIAHGVTSTTFVAGNDPALTYWLGAGPFEAEKGPTFDYFSPHDSEDAVKPAAIDYFRNQQGEDQGWNKIISTRPGIMHFGDFYGSASSKNPKIAYASCSIDSDDGTTISVQFRTGCPTSIFVNGKSLRQVTQESSINIQIPLNPGRNYLLVKSYAEEPRDWYFSLRILDSTVTQNKYKYYLP